MFGFAALYVLQVGGTHSFSNPSLIWNIWNVTSYKCNFQEPDPTDQNNNWSATVALVQAVQTAKPGATSQASDKHQSNLDPSRSTSNQHQHTATTCNHLITLNMNMTGISAESCPMTRAGSLRLGLQPLLESLNPVGGVSVTCLERPMIDLTIKTGGQLGYTGGVWVNLVRDFM